MGEDVTAANTATESDAVVSVTGVTPVRGTLSVPGDKSISHRALMFAALADGRSVLQGVSHGADVQHTAAAIESLGATVVRRDDGGIEVTGGTLGGRDTDIDVGNSGTGIRLLAGLVAGLSGTTTLAGDQSIARRPMDRIVAPLRRMGADIDGREGGRFAPLVVRGRPLSGIEYASPVASAQVKSSVLIAGLTAAGSTTVIEPAASRAHTEEMLAARGADISVSGTAVTVRPSALTPLDETVPGDPSQAAFWLAAAAAVPGSDLTVSNVYLGPGRDGFIAVLQRMGAEVVVTREGATHGSVAARHQGLIATDIGAAEIPGLVDELPVLAVVAALAEGTSRFTGAEELRHKETDRIATITEMLRGFGVTVEEYDDGLTIYGRGSLTAGHVESRGDHRIAMAGAIAGLACEGTTTIAGFDAVDTSYPGFLNDLRHVAGERG